VPCGLSEGLPVGLQIIGNLFDEGRVLQVASAYEGASGGGKCGGGVRTDAPV
jgi:aspartyl-tRNA(Asn)/glutamyl-tRNA(Gln) amidotransferase subunit A